MIRSPSSWVNLTSKRVEIKKPIAKNWGFNINLYGSLKQVVQDKSKFNWTTKSKPSQYLKIDTGFCWGLSRNKYMSSTAGNIMYSTTPKEGLNPIKTHSDVLLKSSGSCKTFKSN